MDRMKNNRTLIIVAIIIAIPLLLLMLVFGATEFFSARTEISDVRLVGWFGYGETSVKKSSPNETVLPNYISIEVSIEEYYRNEPRVFDKEHYTPPQMQDEVIRFENEEYLLVIFAGKEWNKFHCLLNFIFRKNGEKVSYPIYSWSQSVVDYKGHKGIYFEEDRIAKDIVQSYTSGFTERINNGQILYYGVGLEEKLQNLTILGYAPTEVIPFEYNTQTYYFWYYLGDYPFTEVLEANELLIKMNTLEENNNANSMHTIEFFNFNTGEIIECFEIAFSDE